MKSAFSLLSMAMLLAVTTRTAVAADELAPVSQRFAGKPTEMPDFQRHVVPLLGKLGCNGRACHGSFQGQGDFRLSLFGYDFNMDHEGLSERIDTDDPAESYALEKATLKTDHEGGERMAVGSWEYNVFLNWIKEGAKPVAKDAATLVKLHVTPAEIIFHADGEQQQLKTVAQWSDGTFEDVTPLCRFQSNDTQIATVGETGLVAVGSPGDSHIVATYDNAVVPVPVIRPVSKQTGPHYPQVAATTPIDKLVLEKLSKVGIVPSEESGDAEFLRRVTLDLAGTLPTADEVRDFLGDVSPEKRSRKIDQLLESPAYSAWWTTKLCDFTGNSDQQLNNVVITGSASQQWYDWMHKRVADNMPYDDIVEGLVLAKSRREGEDYKAFSERQSQWYHEKGKTGYAEEATNPHYWSRRNFRQPQERAVGFAYTFLGIRIQCAECHKHPFDQWTQDDFKQFQGFFTRTTFASTGADKDIYATMTKKLGVEGKGNQARREFASLLKEGKVVPFPELFNRRPRVSERVRKKAKAAKKKGRKVKLPVENATLLGGEKIDLAQMDDPREPLMDWLRSSNNRMFARAFVNRVWASYFNRGIVEPTDDLSLANPPSNEALLTYLADGFVNSGYDMKWVHREIANSDTYQRTWKPNETNRLDERNFSRSVPRRIPAEVAYDSIQMATIDSNKADEFLTRLDDRATALPGIPRGSARYRGEFYALSVFGKSIRENNCDCERSSEPSLLQTIYLRNDTDLLNKIDAGKASWLAEVAKEHDLEFTSKASVKKPSNYRQTVKRYETQIARYKKQKSSAKSITKIEKRLTDYRNKYGDAKGQDTEQSLAADKAHQIVEEAYLRTLSRFPTPEESQIATAYIADEKDPINGIRSVLWSLLNTKEFIVNH